MKRNIQLLISEKFAEKTIPENDSVRLIDEAIDKMDLTPLYHTYSHLGRRSATTPRTLLKVVIYPSYLVCKKNMEFCTFFLLIGRKTGL